MKLYATVESERAKKGQGGSKKLEVIFLVGGAKYNREIAKITLTAEGNDYFLDYSSDWGNKQLQNGKIILMPLLKKCFCKEGEICAECATIPII